MNFSSTDIPISIIGNHGSWKAIHEPNSVSGPSLLTFNSIPIFNHCICEFGDFPDEIALVDSVKEWRKGNVFYLKLQSHFPFGSRTKLVQSYRYYTHTLRITTDFVIPKQTVISKKISVGSFSLPGKWIGYREVTTNEGTQVKLSKLNELTDLCKKLTLIESWDSHPLALVFRHETGIELEIGLGTDQWRWEKGFLVDNYAKYTLNFIDDEIRFQRLVSTSEENIVPAPRHYTFNWYLSWSMNQQIDLLNGLLLLDVNFNDKQELNVSQLDKDTYDITSNYALNLDLAKINWRLSQKRVYNNEVDDNPCFTAGSTINCLKRIIRQIASLKNIDIPIYITGMSPGFCDCGRHVFKKRPCSHWDMASLIEFSSWTRKILGNKRKIIFNYDKFATPSMQQLFTESDIDYESTDTV